jgi:hypothetical protein
MEKIRMKIKILFFTALMVWMGVGANAAEISGRDQAVVEAMMKSESKGAVIGEPATCLISYGLFDDTGFIGFFGLFPNADSGGCGNSFSRTNPNGTIDDHVYVHGTIFMFLFGGPVLGSEGSDVFYRFIRNEDGTSGVSVNGTTSDGGAVRIRLMSESSGKNKSRSDQIWLENYGYVIGERGKP